MNNLAKLSQLTSVRPALKHKKTAQDFRETLPIAYVHSIPICYGYVSNIMVTCFPEISGHVMGCLLHVLQKKILAEPRNKYRNVHVFFFPMSL